MSITKFNKNRYKLYDCVINCGQIFRHPLLKLRVDLSSDSSQRFLKLKYQKVNCCSNLKLS